MELNSVPLGLGCGLGTDPRPRGDACFRVTPFPSFRFPGELALVKKQGHETWMNIYFYILIRLAPDSKLVKATMLAKTFSGPEMSI